MKPFKKCPSCNSFFIKNDSSIESFVLESCEKACVTSASPCENHNCNIQFRQYYNEYSNSLSYIQFYTKNFHIFSYFLGMFEGETHIYPKISPREQDLVEPIFVIKDLIIDFNNIDKLDQKYKTLSLFL